MNDTVVSIGVAEIQKTVIHYIKKLIKAIQADISCTEAEAKEKVVYFLKQLIVILTTDK